MTKNSILRIGGVPEHFNLPWHYALDKNWFAEKEIDLQWTDYPGGTGAMNKDLRSGILDVAVILTEGIVADIVNGNKSKIVQWYVKSPLVWGIHVATDSVILNDKEFSEKKYAISRYGSGSHLMAFVDAHQRGLEIKPEQFVVVNNLDGAVKALTTGEADLFMWEKFMTKPFVDNGTFRKVGECPTPWPSFVIAVREEYLEKNPVVISNMLKIIQKSCKEFAALPDVVERIAQRFKLQPDDIKEWMKAIEWQTETMFDKMPLDSVVKTLVEVGIIEDRRLSDL
ncbi:MAG TPA: substrate-binding domain-containing protein [Cytophagaceae bacterium]|jgi:ABC-type nitrate/sulfonate/bicarbonate transport system substrate-binding protein|nr:substrate-binding domain-containing protein [Cytophagaceae bacterium]